VLSRSRLAPLVPEAPPIAKDPPCSEAPASCAHFKAGRGAAADAGGTAASFLQHSGQLAADPAAALRPPPRLEDTIAAALAGGAWDGSDSIPDAAAAAVTAGGADVYLAPADSEPASDGTFTSALGDSGGSAPSTAATMCDADSLAAEAAVETATNAAGAGLSPAVSASGGQRRPVRRVLTFSAADGVNAAQLPPGAWAQNPLAAVGPEPQPAPSVQSGAPPHPTIDVPPPRAGLGGGGGDVLRTSWQDSPAEIVDGGFEESEAAGWRRALPPAPEPVSLLATPQPGGCTSLWEGIVVSILCFRFLNSS